VSYRARLDRAQFSAQEARGREIFQGAARVNCSACHDVHTGSLLWGANNGVDATPTDPRDRGPLPYRGVAVGVFRAASLKNIALTAPYMHDGRFATLREVIDHYDHGIQPSANLHEKLRDADGNPLRMNLSEADKKALEAFLRSFTDQAMIADTKFSDPFQ
jgi:cytochrome c peroxidase